MLKNQDRTGVSVGAERTKRFTHSCVFILACHLSTRMRAGMLKVTAHFVMLRMSKEDHEHSRAQPVEA
jgi:hypothetical protein